MMLVDINDTKKKSMDFQADTVKMCHYDVSHDLYSLCVNVPRIIPVGQNQYVQGILKCQVGNS